MPPQTYYFDNAALWKYYLGKHERGYLALQQFMIQQNQPIWVSAMTVLEFVARLTKAYRKGEIKKRDLKKPLDTLTRDIGLNRPFNMTPISSDAYQEAERLLMQYPQYNFGSNDALHLAVAYKLYQVDNGLTIVTSDGSIQQVCQRIGLNFYDPENPTL